MGTNTGLGIGIGIPFKNNALGGDKPYFPPELKARMIGVWTNYGKKNTDADRNIIKNKIPNAGGDLEILNAAYKLNSGFGEYSEDFTTWTKSSKITSVDSESFDFVTNVNWNLLYYKSNIGKDIPSFKVRIKLKGEGKVYYNYITSEGVYTNEAITSEEYITPISYNTKYTGETPVNCGFTIGISNECSGTITQIPNFEDAFVTDGVNDLIISQKTVKEMIGDNDEITVISMVYYINTDVPARISITNDVRGMTAEDKSSQVFARNEVKIEGVGKLGIYGWSKKGASTTVYPYFNILGDKTDYGFSANYGLTDDAKFCPVGEPSLRFMSKQAHYWSFMVIGKLTEDEINLIIGNYNLDRSLKPDILCNIGKQGITNENHAEFNDKLIDYSGNGRDIQMNNLAWKGGSGIAAKPFETIKDYTIVSDEARQKLTIYNEFSYKIKSNTPSYYWTVQSIIRDNTSYQVTIITDKDCYWINATNFINSEGNKESIRKKYPVLANTPTQVIICGLDQFEYPEGIEPTSAVSYVNLKYAGEITVTFIPSYKGGILLDGINDFGQFVGDLGLKDYTFIADRAYDRIVLEQAPFIASTQTNGQAPFLMEYLNEDTYVYPHSFGTTTKTTNLNIQRQISYQSTYVYNGNSISKGTSVDTGDGLTIGNSGSTGLQYSPLCLWSLMLFPYSMSEFLIERQLKKHKLGTLYPNMVEFRPIVKSNNKWDIIEIWQGDKSLYRPAVNDDKTGIYLKKDSTIGIYVKPYVGQKVSEIVYNGVSYTDLKLNSNGFYYKVVPITKSPQKITMTIEQDENYVKFEPVITSNVEYVRLDFYLNNYQKRINIGDYIPKDAYLRANLYLKNNVDELTVFTFNGVNIGYRRSSVDDTAFNINPIYNYDSPQEVNITVDEYIRYEDIVQPYPSFVKLENLDRTYTYTWGDKLKVGDTIRYNSSVNLLEGAYTLKGQLECNGVYVYDNNQYITVAKEMIFAWTNSPIWSIDDNEPKCILSPRLLRIPNSSYKILGYIPDISGHGNHGKINNSAYAEGSGVNEDGSYQFDGVDDFVTIPTVTGGKQVLMKVNWDSSNSALLYDQRGYNNEFAICNGSADSDGNPIPAYSGRNNGQTYIDGILNSNIKASELRAITHNITITNELSAGVNKFSPVIGSNRLHNAYFVNMALYDFMLFDDISTDDKIKELNEYVGIEAKVELPPYYWDAYGKTNSDADKDTIQQRGIAVGDYDITNYNHAYDKMSGYGGYEFAKFDNELDWYLTPNNNHIDVVSRNGYEITLKNLSTSVNGWYFQNSRVIGFITRDIPFKVRANKSIRVYWDMHSYKISSEEAFGHVISITALNPNEDTSINLRHLTEEELAELDANKDRMYYLLWFDLSTLAVNEEVTIEMLPLYPNGLVYDAVTDYSKNSNIPALDDFTAIMKRKWLKKTGLSFNKRK